MKALLRGLSVLALVAAPFTGAAAEEVLNLYSSRHYQTDEALYENFTKETGIKINRIEGKGDALIERIKSEGANSPADVLLTVDAGRLWRAEQAGLFQPVSSKRLDEVVPANLRHPEGLWFGFSTRARLIYYARDRVEEGAIARYEDLADRSGRARSASAPAPTSTTSRCWARSSPPMARRRPRTGPRPWSATSPGDRRAATPISSAAWPRASAISQSPTPITSCAS